MVKIKIKKSEMSMPLLLNRKNGQLSLPLPKKILKLDPAWAIIIDNLINHDGKYKLQIKIKTVTAE